ncbi:ABC transporter ATP-binding protein [Capsulimonas corticalis]|uniref:ABC transporter ATP-binding protein n=1 Tax=Capsulimonas corticalis TaxID=2219043 RepID=A0A402D4V5_9BACT|nr:ABC transporter ATP-binding protein [Capsulimonas corticalis]BDI31933.1 ABC transporter ATP-binding protein [Capsulimonas corticalis]
MTDTAIHISGFRKEYPAARRKEMRLAVKNLDLDVPAGGLFGFLGPNGAGKTTTIKMLLGFIPPTQGSATLFGVPVEDPDARRAVGYLPEQPYFPKFLTAQEVVAAHAGFAGLHGRAGKDHTEALLRRVGAYEYRNLRLSKCSKGMVQRVGLATALAGDPQLLIMDEPSSGLDPIGRKELRELLQELKDEGKTLFISSHLLSEMESLCDRVAVLHQGELVACGAPSEITQGDDEVAVLLESMDGDETLAQEIATLGGSLAPQAEGLRSRLVAPAAVLYRVMGLLEQHKARVISVTQRHETLEDAFLRLVGSTGQ